MAINFADLNKLNEGKTKIIYENPDDPKTVFMRFKDDITAGDGVKHDVIEGKALIDWQTNKDIFEYLNRCGVQTHYISSPEDKVSIVKKLDQKINLEVVSRRVATGSILHWGNAVEGTRYDPIITQFHYKDDDLHDPLLDETFVKYIIAKKNGWQYQQMLELNRAAFLQLEKAFTISGIQLIDMKLEYGLINNEIILIDEITGGSFRLWPYANDNPNFDQENVMSELNPKGRLDKDVYRQGGDLSTVKDKFAIIADITAQFKDLAV